MKKLIVLILFLTLTIPFYSQVIKVSENLTRWSICTESSSYQILLTSDNRLTPGYYGPQSGEMIFVAIACVPHNSMNTQLVVHGLDVNSKNIVSEGGRGVYNYPKSINIEWYK